MSWGTRTGALRSALVLAYGGAFWTSWLHAQSAATAPGQLAVDGLRAGTLALPLIALAVHGAPRAFARLLGAGRNVPAAGLAVPALTALLAAAVHAVLQPLQALAFGAERLSAAAPAPAVARDLVTALVVLLPLALLASQAGTTAGRTASVGATPRLRRVTAGASALVLVTGTSGAVSVLALAPASAAVPSSVQSCLAGGPADKTFDVSAINVDITLNRFGDHDPAGKMYAPKSKLAAVRAQETSHTVSIGLRDDAIQPLVIRANEGDCVVINYDNAATGGNFGMHVDGLAFAVSSSGDAVGSNAASGPAPGRGATYRFAIPDDPTLEGGHYIHPGPGYRSAVGHGLFGALVVEPKGSTYWNPSTPNQQQTSGWEAIIRPGTAGSTCIPSQRNCLFREAVKLHHEVGNDNEVLRDKTNAGIPQQDATTGGYRPGAFALNYRSEPFRNRLLQFPKEKAHSYSSYTFGDPATPMPRGYVGDPTKFRIMHVGGEKFHVYHLHGGGDRWRFNPSADTSGNYAETGLNKDPDVKQSASQRLDSQSIGPGESYSLELEGGAGGVQQSVGDFLFHCHIAKHYVAGMWSVWRVYNTRQPDFVPLDDRPAPPDAVDSAGLIGKTIRQVAADGTVSSFTITAANLDSWIREQLPPAGKPKDSQDATVWDWKVDTSADPRGPIYLGAPSDRNVFEDSAQVIPGEPNLLAVDAGFPLVSQRPRILFDPTNGRPAYPLFRTQVGKRPPFTPAGHTGAPYLGQNARADEKSGSDPWAKREDGLCPQGRQQRKFNVVAINKPIKRTAKGQVDPEGKIFVLAADKDDVYANRKPSVPLALRANQGDCIAVTLTSEQEDAESFDRFSKTTMHIHHVQFDVQGSDGVSAGFAFEHSVRPFHTEGIQLAQPAKKGDRVVALTNVSKFVNKDADGNDSKMWVGIGLGTEGIEFHRIAAVDGSAKTLTLEDDLAADHGASEWAGTEFIQYRWYPDVLLDNIFWHDHVDGIHGWGHGLVGQLIIEPPGSTYHDPVSGDPVRSGTLVDIHTSNPLSPGVRSSFRELALWQFRDNDKSDYASLNLAAEPFGDRSDPANRFSSYKFGDPFTPLPRIYPNDPLVVRAINVSPTVDTLHIQGGRFIMENRYADAAGAEASRVDTSHAGVSEKYTLVFNSQDAGNTQQPGDYLYFTGNDLAFRQGAWGIVRVLPGKVPTLKALPSFGTGNGDYTLPAKNGQAPPALVSPGNPCPSAAPRREFSVTAVDLPLGAKPASAFVPSVDAAAVAAGSKAPEPLVLHAAAKECITVHYTNNRIGKPSSFSVAKLDRDTSSSGVNVGFTRQQNVNPGGRRDYVYYVDHEKLGTAAIADLASDGAAKKGLYGALVVSPANASFTDPVTGAAKDIGSQVLVHVAGAETPHYRDFTVVLADDDEAMGQDFMPYPTNAASGKSAVNYRAAPVGDGPTAFLNPGSTPQLTSYAGDPVLVHAMVAPGSEQTHAFSLGGLTWQDDRFVSRGKKIAAQGVGPWESVEAEIDGGAGGIANSVGDFFYGDLRRPFTQAGMWGLQRVLPAGGATCPIRKIDNSTC